MATLFTARVYSSKLRFPLELTRKLCLFFLFFGGSQGLFFNKFNHGSCKWFEMICLQFSLVFFVVLADRSLLQCPQRSQHRSSDVTGSLKDESRYHHLSIRDCETLKSHRITSCSGQSNQIMSDIKCFAGFLSTYMVKHTWGTS